MTPITFLYHNLFQCYSTVYTPFSGPICKQRPFINTVCNLIMYLDLPFSSPHRDNLPFSPH